MDGMHTDKDVALLAQGTSDPQGPAGVGGIVPALSSSSSDVGLSSVLEAGTGKEGTTAPNVEVASASEVQFLEDPYEDLYEEVDDIAVMLSKLGGDLDDDGRAGPELVVATQDFLQRLSMALEVSALKVENSSKRLALEELRKQRGEEGGDEEVTEGAEGLLWEDALLPSYVDVGVGPEATSVVECGCGPDEPPTTSGGVQAREMAGVDLVHAYKVLDGAIETLRTGWEDAERWQRFFRQLEGDTANKRQAKLLGNEVLLREWVDRLYAEYEEVVSEQLEAQLLYGLLPSLPPEIRERDERWKGGAEFAMERAAELRAGCGPPPSLPPGRVDVGLDPLSSSLVDASAGPDGPPVGGVSVVCGSEEPLPATMERETSPWLRPVKGRSTQMVEGDFSPSSSEGGTESDEEGPGKSPSVGEEKAGAYSSAPPYRRDPSSGPSISEGEVGPPRAGACGVSLQVAAGVGRIRLSREMASGELLIEFPNNGALKRAPPPMPTGGERSGEVSSSSVSGRVGRTTSGKRQAWRRAGRASAILPDRSARCYKCLMVGHVAVSCRGVVKREGLCYRCGASSHKMAVCRAATPNCPLCGRGS